MKQLFYGLVCALILITSTAFAEIETVSVYDIPERYALFRLTGYNPGEPLPKDTILPLLRNAFTKLDVEQFQYLLYDEGKKPGDGARAFGEMRKDKQVKVNEFGTLIGDNAQLQGKLIENTSGYETTPKELYKAYSDNEVVADDAFKGKPVILRVKVPQVAKDPFDKPYIKIGVDKTGMFGLHIYIDKKDPFLRKIKKGSNIIVRGYPKGFVMQSVMTDGVIVSDGESYLIDGKAVPLSEIKKK